MKLSQLYANKSFKHVKFNDGLNLVLAKVTKKLDLNKDSHGLGKSTLIEVLDFMLLKEIKGEDTFKKHKAIFADYVFFLEIILNDGKYLTIKRGVDNATKIAFKSSQISTNFLTEKVWDKENLALEKAQMTLNDYLAFDILKKWSYRKSLTYFLRSQKDYYDVFQLSKFKGQHKDWKPLMFDLLGFNANLLTEKYEIDERVKETNDFITSLKNKFAVDPTEVDKITGAIELKKAEQKETQEKIDSFNFYDKERHLNKEIIEETEAKIANLNTIEYNLSFELEEAEKAVFQKFSFEIDQLKDIYEEAQIFFPNNLVKDYKELEDFNKKITEERNKYLGERIVKLTKELKETRLALFNYNQKRVNSLSELTGKDVFKKFKIYQIELSKIEGEIVRLEEKLNNIDKIEVFKQDIKKYNDLLEDVKDATQIQIRNNDSLYYSEIKRVFSNIFKYTTNKPAILYISLNTSGNIDFKAEVAQNDETDITAEGKGNSYGKMLCTSFDLAILVTYHQNSFYHFAYHDGALENLDNRKKMNFIHLIREYCTKFNLQYIFTAIEDDIPLEILSKFTEKEICLKLDDTGDKGKLFEFSF